MGDRGQRVKIFATKADWTPILHAFEAILRVKYVLSGMFPSGEPDIYHTFQTLPNFGQPVWGQYIQEANYLIMMEETPVISRNVNLNTGETRYVRDHGNNPESVVLWPGGILESHCAVIYGEVSKLSRLEATELLFRSLSKLIKKNFPSSDGFRVGPEAAALKRKGYRLTQDIRSSTALDLSLPASGR